MAQDFISKEAAEKLLKKYGPLLQACIDFGKDRGSYKLTIYHWLLGPLKGIANDEPRYPVLEYGLVKPLYSSITHCEESEKKFFFEQFMCVFRAIPESRELFESLYEDLSSLAYGKKLKSKESVEAFQKRMLDMIRGSLPEYKKINYVTKIVLQGLKNKNSFFSSLPLEVNKNICLLAADRPRVALVALKDLKNHVDKKFEDANNNIAQGVIGVLDPVLTLPNIINELINSKGACYSVQVSWEDISVNFNCGKAASALVKLCIEKGLTPCLKSQKSNGADDFKVIFDGQDQIDRFIEICGMDPQEVYKFLPPKPACLVM